MIERQSVDYIIVGQGIAGSSFAIQALRHHKRIVVIDLPAKNVSSKVAAGLFNPITGKNTVKTWMADQIFPYLHEFYSDVEALTGRKLLFSYPLYKPFASIHEQNEWMGKSADELYADYLDEVRVKPLQGDQVLDPQGGLLLRQCGYINTIAFMEGVRDLIQKQGHYVEEIFQEEEVELRADGVSYKQFDARFLVLCQGIHTLDNKRFKALPIRPLKGETLHINCAFTTHAILNRGVYMVPGNEPGQFRVGATYRYNERSPGVTEEGRAELEEKLKEILAIPFTISGQEWGIRPTTVDRRPILGQDPIGEQVAVFNGLGTKGVSLAPYFSLLLFHWLEGKESLRKEVTLARFK